MPTDPIGTITTNLEGAFRGKAWQGPTLSGSLRGITAARALKRPAPGRKCIWEHALHAAYWKHAVANLLERSLSGDPDHEPPAFPRAPSKGPRPPARPDEKAWRADRRLLTETHERLLDLVSRVSTDRLDRAPTTKHKWPLTQYLVGIAAHDMYHCGQIQLIKRLCR